MHWMSQPVMARKGLGALSGVAGCPGGCKKAYEDMIRSIATWGAKLGWRGQKARSKEFRRLLVARSVEHPTWRYYAFFFFLNQ